MDGWMDGWMDGSVSSLSGTSELRSDVYLSVSTEQRL